MAHEHRWDGFTDKREFDSYPYGESSKLGDNIGAIASDDPKAAEKKLQYENFTRLMDKYQKDKQGRKTLNVLGISTTMMLKTAPGTHARQSTSDAALARALEYANRFADVEGRYKPDVDKVSTVLIKLRDLNFQACAGFYSKEKTACNWPCELTGAHMENINDQMDVIYWALAYWADIVFVATPVRFGNAGSLYYKMVERLNSIHNEITLRNHHVIEDKVAGFIITGGQDGIQATAGQMLTFWSELGYMFSRYSYVGWSRGWYAENTGTNFDKMSYNPDFRNDLKKLVHYAIDLKVRLDRTADNATTRYEDKTRKVDEIYAKIDRPLSEMDKAELSRQLEEAERSERVPAH